MKLLEKPLTETSPSFLHSKHKPPLLPIPVTTTLDEVKTIVHDMKPDESLGPDGLNPTFYKKY